MSTSSSAVFLRRSLLANGGFSLISGIVLIPGARPLAELFGLAAPGMLVILGVGLLIYAVTLLRNGLRERISQTEAFVAVLLDLAWVAGSAAVIFAGVLNTTGNWTVALVADAVLLFGLLQLYGLRRIRRAETGAR